jgi:hypothetical protein
MTFSALAPPKAGHDRCYQLLLGQLDRGSMAVEVTCHGSGASHSAAAEDRPGDPGAAG